MASTGTKKKTGTGKSRKTTAKSSGTARGRGNSGRKKASSQQAKQSSNGLGLEIGILIILAVSILLLISNFELGGSVGNAVSRFFFGLMGWMAYLFPAVLFFGTAFAAVNRKNRLMTRKMTGMVLGFWFLCGLVHLFTVGCAKGETLTGYYTYCAVQKTGGGIIGGGLSKALCLAFGTIGAYVILVIALLISVIVMTQHPLLAPIKNTGEKVYREARENHVRRKKERGIFAVEQLKLPADQIQTPDSDKADTDSTDTENPADKKGKSRKSLVKKRAADSKSENRSVSRTVTQFPADRVSSGSAGSIPDSAEDTTEEHTLPELHIQRPDPAELFPEDNEEKKDNFDMKELTPSPDIPENPQEHTPEAPRKNPKSSPKEIAEGIKNIQNEISEKEEPAKKEYIFPPITLLKKGNRSTSGDSDQQVRETAMKLQSTLHSFGVNATVTNVSCGPTVTRYELQPEQGVKVSKIVGLTDDIKLNLAAADIRIEAPIPGKAAVGIEVPNATNSAVMLRDLLESREFREFPSELAFAVGKDIGGKTVVADIGKMPHLLIAGATGSGKSVCINTLIMSIIYKASPDEVKLIMIDPKVVELSVYNGIPHLFIPVVTDPKKAAGALNWAVSEMTDRYNKFAEYNVRDLKGYNDKVSQLDDIEDENKPKKMPKIVIIVDELADLMMVAPGEVEDAICRLAQLARAAGIHLIIATQRPSVNVITGLIKANMPSRIAFSVSSGVDSRTILDMIGAEKLLGKGDMLYYPQGYQKPARLQGSFVSDKEVSRVVEFLTDHHQSEAVYDRKITDMMNSGASSSCSAGGGDDLDTYFVDAGKFIIEKDKASIGMLQRMFKIGFNRAARIMDQLSEAGVVGPEEGTKPRKVLMSQEEFENYIEESL